MPTRVARPHASRDVRRVLDSVAQLSLLGATALVFLILNKPFYSSVTGYDEGFFVWGGWCIRKGLTPYLEFSHFKPPLVFITHAVAQALCGFEQQGYRAFFAGFPLVAFLLLQAVLVSRGVQRWLAWIVVLAVVFLFVRPAFHDSSLGDSESIGLSYYLLGLAFFLWERRYAKVALLLGGFFMGCCVFSKEPFLPVVIATWLGVLLMRRQITLARAQFFARYSSLGVLIFSVALVAYMVPTGAMAAYVAMAGRYWRTYRGPQSYCVAIGRFHPSTSLDELAESWAALRTTFLNLGVLGYLLPLAIVAALATWRRSRALFAAMLAVVSSGLWASSVSHCLWPHYYNIAIAGVIFALVAGVDSVKMPLTAARRLVRDGIGVVAAATLLLCMYPELARQWQAEYTRAPWREPVEGVLDFVAANTLPTDRIFTTGPPLLYAQADRVSAVRESDILDEFLDSSEGATDAEKLRPMYEQLADHRPKVIVLDPENIHRKRRHLQALFVPYLAEFGYVTAQPYLYVRP